MSSPGQTVLPEGNQQARQDTIDLWQMHIDLMQDEYEKRRELNLKSYMEEEKRIKEAEYIRR